MNRREFCIACVAGIGGLSSNKIQDDIAGKVLEASKEFAYAKYAEFKRDHFLIKLLFEFDKGRIALATEGIDPNQQTSYSNELRAYSCMRRYFGDVDTIFDEQYKEYTPDGHSLVSIGGPGTNLHARDVFGLPQTNKDKIQYKCKIEGTSRFIQFPYSIVRLNEPGPNRLQDSATHTSGRYAVTQYDSAEIFLPNISAERELKEDYLILSRLPASNNSYKILFSALHGPGIRGIRNVLSSLKGNDLLALERVYNSKDHHGFQAVFKCEDFFEETDHNGKVSHAPHSVKLVEGSAKNVKITL